MHNKNLSILIVDDLQFSRIVVKTALKKAGYDGVRMANSAAEALSMMEQAPVDVLLADWMMPEMDGLELTQHVRQRDEERGSYTAIILFTAHDGMDFLVKAFNHGVDDYLCKPPNPQELSARVNAAARIARLQNDLLETSRQLQKTISQLENMGLIDELTGAGNQNFLMQALRAQLKEVNTRDGGICFMLIELRELSGLQKKHGKQVSNEVIVSLYRRLRTAVRPTDTVARLDKNIFAVLMRYSDTNDYKRSTVERILNTINSRAYKTKAGSVKIHGCIGVDFYEGKEPIEAEEIFKHAQTKLNKVRKDRATNVLY